MFLSIQKRLMKITTNNKNSNNSNSHNNKIKYDIMYFKEAKGTIEFN